jgi:Peptidase family M23/Putative peptidoglycan binding domain
MALRASIALLALLAVLAVPAAAQAVGDPNVAGLQVGLRARGLYMGSVDGVMGPGTRRAVMRFQRRARITVDGVSGRQTRRALGRYGRHRYSTRMLHSGMYGWDVVGLQFKLAWHGFPSGPLDGGFGPRTAAALRRFQRWAHLGADGVAGPVTFAALRRPFAHVPFGLRRPLQAPLGDGFGPRGNSFHAGLDFPASYGASVRAAASGHVVRAGWDSGGYGYLVVIAHRSGVRTFYAHLSSLSVRRGRWVGVGARVGRVGASGHATGPHLHFEVRIRGAAVNPLAALR